MVAVSIATALFLAGAGSDSHTDRESVTEYAQRIDVQQLDPSLPSQPLDEWLRGGPARGVEVRWRQTECGLKHVDAEPAEGYPLCADFMFEQSGVSVRGSIVVGTIRDGIKDQPRFTKAWIRTAELARKGRGDVANRLSAIPELIAKYRHEAQ